MTISIWHHHNNPYMDKLAPDLPVFTMRMVWKRYGGWCDTLCDVCFLSKRDRSEHFWYKDMRLGKCELERIDNIPFYDYLQMHFETIKCLNALWDLGRLEFIRKWQERWYDEIIEYQLQTGKGMVE